MENYALEAHCGYPASLSPILSLPRERIKDRYKRFITIPLKELDAELAPDNRIKGHNDAGGWCCRPGAHLRCIWFPGVAN